MKLIKMLALLLAISTICMSDLYATIIHVPADYPTISSAISAASPGDTIIVAAGVYNEHVVINVANLTLLGAQANVDARMRTYIPANESIITFATPAFGTGIVNIASPNVIFNGFTVQGNGTIENSTGAIFAGDAGVFLPSTITIDVTGLQLLNNIVQNNANGILIASIEPTPKTPNYLVQYNYLQNNSGDPNSGNGQGVFFNNSAGTVMTNVTVTENLFNGMETNSSVLLSNVTTATVSYNVMNQDNSIVLFATTGVSIIGNVTSGATGITPEQPFNIADAIFVGPGCSNTTITDNLIYTATRNGIQIFQGNSNITITDNCIVGNTLAGISLNGGEFVASSNITINNNNIRMNTTGLNLDAGSYTSPPPLLDATSNYWNSALGPNYNGTSPGAGDLITDNNIPATQTVQYTPFLTNAIACPSPVTLTNTTTNVNVLPGTPVSFVVTITVAAGETPFNAVSFTDPLPSLTSGSAWTIATQSPSGFFTIAGAVGSQNLALTTTLPSQIAPGTYTVTLTANTTLSDAGETLPSTATMTIQIEGPTGISQNISATATASVAAVPPQSVPMITKVNPNSGSACGGSSVTINGTNFTGATAVLFESTPATSFIINSDTSITAVSPPRMSGIVDIRVVTPSGISEITPADQFTYQPVEPPTNFHGKVQYNQFATQEDVIHLLSWEATPDLNVIGYKIFQNHKLIKTIYNRNADKLKLHNRKKNKVYHYEIVAFTACGESQPAKLNL